MALTRFAARWWNRLRNLLLTRSAYRFIIRDWQNLGDLRRCADVLATLRASVNLEPLPMDAPLGKRLLVIAPHPDDEMLGAGGTLMKALAKGATVRVLYLTQGRRDHADRVVSEARTVAEMVGYATRFLPCYSRELPLDEAIQEALREEIEDFRADTLFVPFLCDDHDDHRRASHLLWLANQRRPLPPMEVWAYQVYTALLSNVVSDITEMAEAKRAAVRTWASQAAGRDWAHFALGLNAFNSRFLPPAPGARYAEAFFVVPLKDYCDLCERYFAPGAALYYSAEYAHD